MSETKTKPKSAEVSYAILGTKFFSREEAIAILKNDSEFTKQDWLDFFLIDLMDPMEHDEEYREFVPHCTQEYLFDLIEKTPRLTVTEAFIKYQGNQEQLMRALTYFSPEEIAENLGSEIISTEVITKQQKRTIAKTDFEKNNFSSDLSEDMFETIDVTFEDTYKLHRISKDKLKIEEDGYTVECNCTSTGRKYFLFVESEYATDAITAVASTFRNKNGERMTKEEYILMEAES
jgi:hypothetical protein